jgi:hypothetical protein
MKMIIELVEEYLTSQGWTISRNPEQDWLMLDVITDNAEWRCDINADEEQKVIFVHSICPLKAAADKQTRMAEFLMRVNRVIYLGHFFMDYDTGGIQFETYLYADGNGLNPDAMESAIGRNIAMMETYLAGITKIVSTETTPADALAEILSGKPADRGYIYN